MDWGQATSWYLFHLQLFESMREEENAWELINALSSIAIFVMFQKCLREIYKMLNIHRLYPVITLGVYTLKSYMPDFFGS